MADINPILQAAARASVSSAKYQSDMNDNLAQNNAQDQVIQASIMQQGRDAATSLQVLEEGKMAAQNKGQTVADLLGNDPTDINSRIARLIQDHVTYTDAALAKDKNIQQMQSVGFMDAPITWLQNQFTLPRAIDDYNATAAVANDTAHEIATTQELTSASAQAYNSIAKTITTESIAADMDAKMQLANEMAAKARQASLGHNAQILGALNQASMQQLDVASKVYGAQDAAERMSMERQRLEQFLSDKKVADDGLEQYAQAITAGRRMENINAPLISAKEATILARNSGPKEKEDLLRWYTNGINSLSQPGFAVPLANNVVDSTLIVLKNGVQGQPKELQPTAQLLTTAYTAVAEQIKAAATPQEKQAILANQIASVVRNQAANPESSDTNIFHVPSVQTVAATTPAVMQTPFAKAVLLPALNAKATNLTPDQMIEAGKVAVDEGRLSFNDMVDGIAKFYRAGVTTNNALGKTTKFGLPPQQGYKVPIDTGGYELFGTFRSSTTDMTDPTSIRRTLLIQNVVQRKLDPNVPKASYWQGDLVGSGYAGAVKSGGQEPLKIIANKNFYGKDN